MGAAHSSRIRKQSFGSLPDGREATLFTLSNGNGLEVTVTDFGATITSVVTPDRTGALADVVLGFDSLDAYLAGHPYLGSTIGRYANRIAGGVFTLDGEIHRLTCNNGPNHLHGGEAGFHAALWTAEVDQSIPRLRLDHLSPDGDGGYPGRLTARVTMVFNDHNELRIDYRAITDRPTHVNLTNHSYFNLTGSSETDVLGHLLTIDADRFTPTDADSIPLGELRPVDGSPMDFRTTTAIGTRIDDDDEQLRFGAGYDHNWVLNTQGSLDRPAARVVEPESGRTLEVLTSEPGVQLYTGNFLDGSLRGRSGDLGRRCAFCLETQHFPDSPNHPDFPSTVLRPGEVYRSTTIYRFGMEA